MSKIFIIGATGGVGSRLGPMLVDAGHDVTGLHRKPEQAGKLENAGITPRLGDIIDHDRRRPSRIHAGLRCCRILCRRRW